jgi:hypothetical protein
VLDLIDERRLAASEVRTLASLIVGSEAAQLPHPDLDLRAFIQGLAELQRRSPEPDNLLRGFTTPWIDPQVLSRTLKGGGCVLS